MPADANFSSLAAVRESAWGTLPDLNTTPLKQMRFTGEGVMHNKDTITSEEIRSDRQVSDLVEVGASAGGNINFELSFAAWLEWFEAAMFTNAVVINATGLTCTAATAGQTITASTGTPFANVIAGCYVKVAGFGNAGNNGAKLVVSKTDTVLTLAAGSIVANQVGATGVSVTGKHLKNGILRHSYTIERAITDTAGSQFFQSYAGMVVDKFNLSFESKKIVTGSAEFVGKAGAVSSASLMAATAVAATGTLTFAANPANNDTVTVGAKTYTAKSALTGGGVTANEFLIGATASDTLDNLIAAIIGGAGAGTLYGSATVAHTLVTAAAGTGDTMDLTAITPGTAGNSIATTETFTDAGNVFASPTLSGGVAADAYGPADTDPVLNATSNLGGFRKDGVLMSERFKKLDIAIANNVRGRDAIGERGNFDVGVGEFGVTGSLSAYFEDNTMLADFIAHTYTALAYLVTNNSGKSIGIHIPRLNFATGGPPVKGKNQDVMQDQNFTAILSPDYDATLLVSFLD